MSRYECRNIIYCENINEEVRQKYDFGLLQSMNGQVTTILGDDKCSGSPTCKLENIRINCPILKKERDKKIEQEKEILLNKRNEDDKWNF